MMRAALCLLPCLLTVGCAEYVKIRSSWYVIEENNRPVTYIAVLNQGNTAVTPEKIIVNPIRDKIGFGDQQHDGWELNMQGKALQPGEFLLTKADSYYKYDDHGARLGLPWGACQIPIEINVKILEKRWLVVSEMNVAMPGTVPIGWDDQCLHPKPLPKTTQDQEKL